MGPFEIRNEVFTYTKKKSFSKQKRQEKNKNYEILSFSIRVVMQYLLTYGWVLLCQKHLKRMLADGLAWLAGAQSVMNSYTLTYMHT